jgi:hypothetical protein
VSRTRSDVFAFACRCQAALAKATGRILLAEKLENEAERWDLDKATTAIELHISPSHEITATVELEDITDLVTATVALEDITDLCPCQETSP